MKLYNKFYKVSFLGPVVLVFSSIILLFSTTEAVCETICDKYYEKAMELWHQNKIEEAEQVFSLGISKCPYETKLYFQRAKIKQEYFNNCEGAVQDYTIVLKLNPDTKIYHPKSYYKRGLCWYKWGKYDFAVRDFSGCIKLNPKYDGRVYVARAKAFAKLGMIKKAVEDLKNCSKFDKKYAQGQRAIAVRKLLEEILGGKAGF